MTSAMRFVVVLVIGIIVIAAISMIAGDQVGNLLDFSSNSTSGNVLEGS